jgi:hypothetical protein
MAIRCKIVADDEQDSREVAFVVVPRVGEFIDLAGGGGEPYRVTRVVHESGGGPIEMSIRLDVTRQML